MGTEKKGAIASSFRRVKQYIKKNSIFKKNQSLYFVCKKIDIQINLEATHIFSVLK
jgi:hypothetical protein